MEDAIVEPGALLGLGIGIARLAIPLRDVA